MGCGPGGPIEIRLRPEVERPERAAVILLADGLDPDVVRVGVAEGWLPNIERRFVRAGVEVRSALAPLPSITYASLTSVLTGAAPAEHGVLGIYWFDRAARCFRHYDTVWSFRAVNADLPAEIPTLYERLEGQRTASVLNFLVRGVTDDIPNTGPAGIMWMFQNYTSVDKMTANNLSDVVRRANAAGRWPTLLTMYFPAVDAVGHKYGPNSPEYRAAVAHFDHQLGRVCDWYERAGLADSTLFVLLSDHGMLEVRPEQKIDIVTLVRDRWGRNATDQAHQHPWLARRRHFYDRFDTVIVHQTGRRAWLHFAGAQGWDSRLTPAEVDRIMLQPPAALRLWNQPGMQLVAYRAADPGVIVRDAAGQARLLEDESAGVARFRYVPETADVLGYLADEPLAAFVAAGWHTDREWLAATAAANVPDVVSQLGPLLRHPHAGDVLAFPATGYAFKRTHGGHGGVDRDEMCATLYFAGPGVEPGGVIDHGRLLDITPTVYAWLTGDECRQPRVAGRPLLRTEAQAHLVGR